MQDVILLPKKIFSQNYYSHITYKYIIGAGNKLIWGLSALGAGGCEFKSHFLDIKSMLIESMLELVPVMATLNILIITRENTTRLKKNSLEWSLLTLTATLFLWASFDREGQFQAIKNWSEFLGRHLLRWMVSPSFSFFLTALLTPICVLIS